LAEEGQELVNTCPFCRGKVTKKKVEHVHRWEGRLYILRNVPAEVCSQCGELFFGPRALKAMDDVVSKKGAPTEHVSVPVFTL
jgi:YgiT-type zinc finger domain-containing protein